MTQQPERLEVKAAFSTDETGVVEGIAWPFGSVDLVGDIIEPAAVAAAVGKTYPMLYGHQTGETIGTWSSVSADAEGLKVKGRLQIADIEKARTVKAQMNRDQSLGLSIGFYTREAVPRPEGGRVIKQLDLVEISICEVPCNPGARVLSHKESSMTAAIAENLDTKAIDEKLAGIETKMNARFDAIEAKANRLDADNDNDQVTPEQKAFSAYIRRGDAGLADEDRKALVVGTDATAGFLAPTTFGSEILKALREYSPIRQYAKVITISARDVRYPRRVGSTAATWVGETADRTESGPSYEQVTLTPYELATFVEVSRQLLEDNSYNLEGELASDLAESFAIAEATAFVGGNGTGKPKGILSASGITTVVSGKAATMGDNPGDTLIDMFAAIPTAHAQNGAWAMNRKTLAAIRKVKDTTGQYIWQPPLQAGMPSSLLGRPVIEMVDFPDIAANAFPVVFGDWSGYRIVDRVDMSILSDPYTRATNGINVFHARKRVGGDVTNPDRFVKLKIAAS